MWDPKVHVGVAGLLYNNSGQLLIQRRSLNASHGAGKWSVPGGWVDAGEEPEVALAREFAEEVDLNVMVGDIRDAVSNTHPSPVDTVICLFYDVGLVSGTPRVMEPEKCIDLTWMLPREALLLDLFEPLRDYFRRLH
jgi:8-oxo-dGTP diphosphatase